MLLNVLAANLILIVLLGGIVSFGALTLANQWEWRIVGFVGLLGLLNLMAWMQANNHAGARAVLAFLTGWAR